jgi:DNA-binding protein YbaB
MFDKIMEAQQKAGEVKQRLDNISVSGTAEGGKITVVANGNKVVQSISIDADFFKDAENVSQSEMAAVTQQMLGGMGGLFGK